jgi:hypothetical protein
MIEDDLGTIEESLETANTDGVILSLYRNSGRGKEKIPPRAKVGLEEWMDCSGIDGCSSGSVGTRLYLGYGGFVTTSRPPFPVR